MHPASDPAFTEEHNANEAGFEENVAATSYMNSGPSTLLTVREKPDQLVPIS